MDDTADDTTADTAADTAAGAAADTTADTAIAEGLLSGLDAEQRHAVTTDSSLVAVIAGAGSGKTRVLTRRVAWRVHTGAADPRHVLVVTFTREAAGELRRRLPALGLRDRIEAGTFHSVMLGILRQHWTDRRRSVPTVVSDRRRLLAEVIEAPSAQRRSSGAAPRRYPGDFDDLIAEVDWAASRGLDPARYVAEARAQSRRPPRGIEAVGQILSDYATAKARRGVIDLDDVLRLAIETIEGDDELAQVIAWRFRHLFVDEAQDLNPLQHRLVDLLRRDHDDLFLVGDPAQAIYGFTGADPSLLIDVSERFRGVEIIRLKTNHRCSPQVVEIGRHVIERASMVPTAIASSRPDGPAVSMRTAPDEHGEADLVATWLLGLDPELLRSTQVAVLARTHAQLQVLRDRLAARSVPVRHAPGSVGSPYRPGIEAAARQRTPTELRIWAHDLLEELEHRSTQPDPTDPIRRRDNASDAVTTESIAVAGAVLDYLREQPQGDGPGFRAWMTAMDPLGVRADNGVELLTFHAAKGREWNTVVVAGVETGLVPHRSATTGAGRAEEARLLYVALTRAEARLLITHAQRRGGYQRKPSPLLDGFIAEPLAAPLAPDAVLPERRRAQSDPVIEALRAWRAGAARAANILPEQFCSDHVLREIAAARPGSAESLAQLNGIGIATAQRWYRAIAAALSAAETAANDTQSSNSAITGA